MRDQLPALTGVAYLNAGTNGPVPEPAARAMAAELRRQATEPRIGREVFERFWALRDDARSAAAAVVGAPVEQMALTSSTTQGIGLMVAAIDFAAGDRVITTTEEHPGLLGPLDMIERRFGVVVRAVAADELESAIDERTRLVAVSHVLWTTGRVLPLAELSRRAHEAGALVLVDGAQSVGNIAVDARATGADFYAFSGQKWLLGPQGSGALWVHPRHHERLLPALPGYLSFREGVVGEYRTEGARFDAGTADPVTLAGFAAALNWVEGLPGGRSAWVERGAVNAQTARERLAAVAGVRVVDPGGPGSGLIALAVDDGDPADIAAGLVEHGVLVRSIPGTTYLRISVGAWTSEADLDALARGLSAR